MTKKKTGARRSTPASASSSRTSHSNRRRRPPIPIPRPLLVLAALVALLAAAALVLLPLPAAAATSSASSPSTSTSSPGVVGHMQRIFFQPLTKNASPPLSRFFRANGLFAQKNAMSTAPDDNTVDADSFHPRCNNDGNDGNNDEGGGEPVLPLPAPGQEGSAEALQLNLGGDGVKLDALGPMVVNSDGSLSRIANWDRMAEIEKRNTLRVIGKRNKERLARLRGE